MVLALDTVEISDWRSFGKELSLSLCLCGVSHSGTLTLARFSRRYFQLKIQTTNTGDIQKPQQFQESEKGIDWQDWQVFLEGVIRCEPTCLLYSERCQLLLTFPSVERSRRRPRHFSVPSAVLLAGELRHAALYFRHAARKWSRSQLSSQGSVTFAWYPPQTIKRSQGEANNVLYEVVKPS